MFLLSLPMRERGLKYYLRSRTATAGKSLPMRGAWIEITMSPPRVNGKRLSLPMRGAWIEIRP